MMKRLKCQVSQQHEDNRTILNEVERMRAEIYKPQETSPSILQPNILNFDNTGSSANHHEIRSSIPADATLARLVVCISQLDSG